MQTVRKEQSIFRVASQRPVRLAHLAGIGIGDLVHAQRGSRGEHDVLAVPAVELETGARVRAVPRQPVVVPGPVPVARPHVDDHVVDIVGQVQQAGVIAPAGSVDVQTLELLEGCEGRARLLAQREHLVERGPITLFDGEARVFEHVPVVFLAAVVGAGEGTVRALAGVVESPVQAVDVEVHEHSVRSRVARVVLEISHELVPRELGIRLVAGPSVAVVGARSQDDRVELLGRVLAKQGIPKLRRAVLALEPQAERMFPACAGLAEVRALDLNAAVDLETLRAIGVDQFDRAGSLPGGIVVAGAGVRVDAG